MLEPNIFFIRAKKNVQLTQIKICLAQLAQKHTIYLAQVRFFS